MAAPFLRPLALLALYGLWLQVFLSGYGGKGWRHAVSLALAVAVAVALSRLAGPAAWGAATLLAAVSLAGLAVVLFLPAVRGAQSWIRLGPVNLQPSELAKVGLIFANAIFLGSRGGRGLGPGRGLAFVGLATAVVAGLTLLQPDLGTAIVIVAISWGQTLASGASKRVTVGIPLALLAALVFAGPALFRAATPYLQPHQVARIESFLDPEADPEGASWQVRQAHMALAAGGWVGTGYGATTREELGWLPERENDFIFAVVGRTGGFVAAAAVIGLYAWAVLAALGVALGLPLGSARQLCIGLAAYLGAHAALNIAVVVALVPATGFPLVPLSAGGSSLLGLGALAGLAAAALRAGATGYNATHTAPRGIR